MIKQEKDGSVLVRFDDLDMQRVKRHVREMQKRLSALAADPSLTEAEAERLGVPPGSSLTDLSRDNLGLLANHYLEEIMGISYELRFWQQTSGSDSQRMFADARLETLRLVMGDGEFDAAIAEKDEEWTRRFADTEEAERNLAPCRTCGKPRDFASISLFLDDGICDTCEREVEEAELGPCVSCGGERELVGSAYTEGRCHDCAARELAPCKQCGGTRWVYHSQRDGGFCLACLGRQFEPCTGCGQQLDAHVAQFGDTLCFECFRRRWAQSTCPSCGGQHPPGSWGRDPDALCGTCAEQRLGPCINCGSPLRLRDKGKICGPCRVNRHFTPSACPST
jgi:hypothetical protein